jgi:hypothetical protein
MMVTAQRENNDTDGDGATGDNVDNVDGEGVTGYDNDDGDATATARRTTMSTTIVTVQRAMTYGATGDNVGETSMGTARWATMTTMMATLGWEHGRCCHQAYLLPGRWGG